MDLPCKKWVVTEDSFWENCSTVTGYVFEALNFSCILAWTYLMQFKDSPFFLSGNVLSMAVSECVFLEKKLCLGWGNFAWPAYKKLQACGIYTIHVFLPAVHPTVAQSHISVSIFNFHGAFRKVKWEGLAAKLCNESFPLLLPEHCGTHFSILWLAYFIPVLAINSTPANWSLQFPLPIYTAGHHRVKYHLYQHWHPSL